MEKHQTYFNLLEALEEGCPICFLIKKAVGGFMDNFLYECVNDTGTRQEIKAAQGFCNRHAWQLRKLGDGFGQAIVYHNLMEDALKLIVSPAAPKEICIFCKQEKDVQERYISQFKESFDDPEFSHHYQNSFGLCLPHLLVLLKSCKDKKISAAARENESAKIKSIIEELKEFERKQDYRFSHEGFGKEGDAWIRAIEKFIGKEGIF